MGTLQTVMILTARTLWLSELSNSGASPRTIDNYRAATGEAFKSFASHHKKPLSKLLVAEITRDDIVSAVAAHRHRPDGRTGEKVDRAASSSSSFFTAVRSFFAWCVTTEKLAVSPAVSVKRPKTPTRVPKAMSAEECKDLLHAAKLSREPERDTLAVLLGLTMGLRLAEMAELSTVSFLPTMQQPTHLRVFGKGSKERVVPVPAAVCVAVSAYAPVRNRRLGADRSTKLFISQRSTSGVSAMTREGLGRAFDRLICAAGLKTPGRRVHVSRHSFATHVLAAGADILAVSELLGHTSVATTQVYLKVDPQRLLSAVAANPLAHLNTPTAPSTTRKW